MERGKEDESQTIRKKNVCKVQNNSQERCRSGNLREQSS